MQIYGISVDASRRFVHIFGWQPFCLGSVRLVSNKTALAHHTHVSACVWECANVFIARVLSLCCRCLQRSVCTTQTPANKYIFCLCVVSSHFVLRRYCTHTHTNARTCKTDRQRREALWQTRVTACVSRTCVFAQAGGCVCLAQIACQLAWRQWANATSHRPNNAAEYILYVSACVGPPNCKSHKRTRWQHTQCFFYVGSHV